MPLGNDSTRETPIWLVIATGLLVAARIATRLVMGEPPPATPPPQLTVRPAASPAVPAPPARKVPPR
jgi:hypothetical protein